MKHDVVYLYAVLCTYTQNNNTYKIADEFFAILFLCDLFMQIFRLVLQSSAVHAKKTYYTYYKNNWSR